MLRSRVAVVGGVLLDAGCVVGGALRVCRRCLLHDDLLKPVEKLMCWLLGCFLDAVVAQFGRCGRSLVVSLLLSEGKFAVWWWGDSVACLLSIGRVMMLSFFISGGGWSMVKNIFMYCSHVA